MPVCAGRRGKIHTTHGLITTRERCTQNVLAATMGETSGAVAALSLGRMILVSLLVWCYCLAGCLGEPAPPAVLTKALEIAGHLETLQHKADAARFDQSPSLDSERLTGLTQYIHENRDRIPFGKSLEMEELVEVLLLFINEHLKNDEDQGYSTESDLPNIYIQTNENVESSDLNNIKNTHESHDEETKTKFQQFLTNVIAIAKETLQSERPKQAPSQSSAQTLQHDPKDISVEELRGLVSDIQLYKFLRANHDASGPDFADLVRVYLRNNLKRSDHNGVALSLLANSSPQSNDNDERSQNAFFDQEKSHSLPFESDTSQNTDTGFSLLTKLPVRQNRQNGLNDPVSLESIVHRSVKSSRDSPRGDGEYSYNSLTHLKDQSIYAPDSNHEDSFRGPLVADENNNNNKLENKHLIEQIRDAYQDERRSTSLAGSEELTRNLSTYLGASNFYLSRTRRSSPTGKKKKNGRQRLFISFGHVSPCELKDRHFCMHGGTCVFVAALDIKTCRCPLGYTGVRCAIIDQEYILSLLTNLIFTSA
ncbi:uncharacterized protein LOC131954481 [Physella acuta]|uniref:uncharacterized protein LOC131954481 n=1 Tax=Physella acuta TaxID=109671 RepID=UPI0027DE4B09|nr:uncharacterized protein LOC131954481 [Physella acuta]XP_059174184.1 uncharacterized protein LOC131954481 [Physella acuta]XP_059174185.1 uncharacterized protein LOC131954481 [Physella acuta]XP_059174186.1 uncharacterized protein LOC131954481 [Physella acuta]XP_059174187.1 uncharacterized protein LOC131954481 [Physella acuta]XP_059174188.1 uncharacterized protein LOC131954481 [Physella acuta]